MIRYLFSAALILLSACSNNPTPQASSQNTSAAENPNFFPVTAYIKGQIHDIRQKGLTPIKYTTVNNQTDSVMVKLDQLNELCNEFLQPEIDTANLISFFTETKFLDQTINAFTFTYEPKTLLPDSIPLKHWDVYIDPETSKVKRIYIIKAISKSKTLQLTWQSNEWFKTTTIRTNPDGSSTVEKEERISWNY
jgi:hypothetical protein